MLATILLVVGFIALFWGANHLINGSIGIAYRFHLPPLVVGFTIVALASSAPQIILSLTAVLQGQNDLAISTAIGSNIANIGFVLGITALIRPLSLRATLWRREYPILFVIMLFMYSLILDGFLSILDGILLIIACLVAIGYLMYISRSHANDAYAREFNNVLNTKNSLSKSIISLIIGIIVLPLSTNFIVMRIDSLAAHTALTPILSGLTFTAIGTCLPQLFTSIMAVKKNQDDIAIGNILGANAIILLLAIAIPGLINPEPIGRTLLYRDIPAMFILALVLLLISYHNKKKLTRIHGGLLLLIYFSYISSLFISVNF